MLICAGFARVPSQCEVRIGHPLGATWYGMVRCGTNRRVSSESTVERNPKCVNNAVIRFFQGVICILSEHIENQKSLLQGPRRLQAGLKSRRGASATPKSTQP